MEHKFKWKVFLCISLFFSFFIVLISGTILYLAPPGRIVNWSDWNIIGLTKREWKSLHIVFSYSFAVLSIFHLFSINWKAFCSYIVIKSKKGLNRKTEIVAGTALIILLFIGTRASVPPFSTVVNFGETLTHRWENKEKVDASPVLQTETVQHKNVNPENEHNKTSKGKGYGRMTVEDVANDLHIDVSVLIERLESNNIEAKRTETLKTISTEAGTTPRDIYDILSK